MEDKKKKYSLFGYRKFVITLVAFALIMVTGHYMDPSVVSPVIWGLVSALGLSLTGSVVRGLNKTPKYGDEGDNY